MTDSCVFTFNERFRKNPKTALSLVETMIGLVLFFLVFGSTFKAFAPTATDTHNLLRGVTVAMSACNWYLNELERKINYEGAIDAADLGEHDVTSMLTEEAFSDIKMLRALSATSIISITDNLYNVQIKLRWGNHETDTKRNHSFELARLIVQPDF